MTKHIDPKSLSVESAYVLDAPYTWSYFEYQNPLLMNFVANINGFSAPSISDGFTYCDLGCGNGVSNNLLASAFPKGHFVGVDFNAEHIENANHYVRRAGIENAEFVDASFENYAEHNPPKFDYIVMHGIYSWVGEEIRAQIRTLVDKTLKPGGLLYVCYNTLPGWSELIPLWKMMQMYIADAPGNSIEQAQFGLRKIAELRDNNAKYFRDHPSASSYLDRLLARDPHYVAHEFCNGCFEPQYFIDVAKGFEELGLTYAGTAKIFRNNPSNIISNRFDEHLKDAESILEAESRRSFIRNEFFRRDIYVRNDEMLSSKQRTKALSNFYVAPNVPEISLKKKFDVGRRTIDANERIYGALFPLLAEGSRSIGELIEHPHLERFGAERIIDATLDLIGGEQFQVVNEPTDNVAFNNADVMHIPSAMNVAFLEDRLDEEGKTYMESASLGSAIRLSYIHGIFLRALNGRSFSEAKTIAINEVLGMDSTNRNKLDIQPSDNLVSWVGEKADRFEKRYLPLLLRFGVVKKNS